jgi:thioredoxin 1
MLLNANSIEVVRKAIALDELVIVDVYATWCPPCKALAPILEQVSDLCYIVKVNSDDVQEAAVEFNVSGLPTLLFFKNGKLLHTVLGLISRQDLEAKINQYK